MTYLDGVEFRTPLDPNVVTFDELPWKINLSHRNSWNPGDICYKWVATFVHEVIPQIGHLKVMK